MLKFIIRIFLCLETVENNNIRREGFNCVYNKELSVKYKILSKGFPRIIKHFVSSKKYCCWNILLVNKKGLPTKILPFFYLYYFILFPFSMQYQDKKSKNQIQVIKAIITFLDFYNSKWSFQNVKNRFLS